MFIDPARRGARASFFVLAAAVPAACGGESRAASADASRGSPPARAVAVSAVPAELGEIARSLTVTGTVEPIRVIGVNSRVAGEVLELNVEEGDAVPEGAVLARLDDREVQADLRSAEAAYEVARSVLARSEQLRASQMVTEAEYERDASALAAAEARRDQLRTRAEYSTIRSPLAGVVTEKQIEVGDIIGNQARLFTIADLSIKVVRVSVSELDVVELREGQEVAVVLDALPDVAMTGRLRRIFPSADPASRLVPVEVALQGESAARPGFLARVAFELGSRPDVVLVPVSAIQGAGTAEFVYVVEDGVAVRRPVVSGLTSRGRVEVRENLDPGELVVVAGQNMIRDGAAVRIVDEEADAVRMLEGAPVDSPAGEGG